MEQETFQMLLETARAECREKLESTKASYALGSHARYDLDLERGTMRFSDAGGAVRVTATIQVAGTWFPSSNEWLWGWDNDALPIVSREQLTVVRELGVGEDLYMLSSSFGSCRDIEAWAMTALAGKLLDCEGFYRAPTDSAQLFLLLFSLRAA
jgi:hypothetical protein